jgi:hypothetical protein
MEKIAKWGASHYYGDQIKGMREAGDVVRTWQLRNAYKILVGEPESKRPLGRPSRRWEDNVKLDIKEIVCESVDWIHVA